MIGKVYKITNLVNGKAYVGKTTKSIEERWKKHMLAARYNKDRYLYKAIQKYGIENFAIDLLQETNELDDTEKFWIDYLNTQSPSGYNMTIGGDGGDTSGSPLYQRHLRRVRTVGLFSGANNGMFGKLGVSNPNYGTKRGPNSKISVSQKKNWETNDNRRIQASLRAKGNKHGYYNKKQAKPIVLHGIRYNSIGQAAKATGLSSYFVKKFGIFEC